MPQAQLEKRKTETTTDTHEDIVPAVPGKTDEVAELLDDTDALLDEIDAVLDETAVPKVAFTLADAIREGCELAPQSFGHWQDEKGATCALGAAYQAIKARGLV